MSVGQWGGVRGNITCANRGRLFKHVCRQGQTVRWGSCCSPSVAGTQSWPGPCGSRVGGVSSCVGFSILGTYFQGILFPRGVPNLFAAVHGPGNACRSSLWDAVRPPAAAGERGDDGPSSAWCGQLGSEFWRLARRAVGVSAGQRAVWRESRCITQGRIVPGQRVGVSRGGRKRPVITQTLVHGRQHLWVIRPSCPTPCQGNERGGRQSRRRQTRG